MDMVRIGMVGARYGATVHLQNLAALRGTRVQVTGICSQSRESAEACARRFEIPFVRMGVHPIGAVLHLKAFEGQVRHGRPIRPVSVVADVAPLMRLEAARREQRKWIPADPEDVENWGSILIAFEDGTRAVVSVTDAGLGGLQEKVSVYMTNAVLHANLAQNTAVQAYAPDGAIFGEEYFTEKLETKAGWTFPSPDEDWFRGYPQEMRDFVDAIREGREPLAGLPLAADCIEVIYAAYLSAEEGRRVQLQLV